MSLISESIINLIPHLSGIGSVNMQELAFEIQLTDDDIIRFPTRIVQHAQAVHVLKLNGERFVFLCRMSEKNWGAYNSEATRSSRSDGLSVKMISEERSGDVFLRVAGRWLGDGGATGPEESRLFEFIRSMEGASIDLLQTPVIAGNTIRFVIVAETEAFRRLLDGLMQANIRVKIDRLRSVRVESASPLNELTLQQMRVLRLAHAIGYYEIPRKGSTEDIAKALEMDKTTAGEHLRRAEKHVFDTILMQN